MTMDGDVLTVCPFWVHFTFVQAAQTELTTPTTGLIPSTVADASSLDTNFPASADTTDAATGPSASISRLVAGNMDGATAPAETERTDLSTKLAALKTSYEVRFRVLG